MRLLFPFRELKGLALVTRYLTRKYTEYQWKRAEWPARLRELPEEWGRLLKVLEEIWPVARERVTVTVVRSDVLGHRNGMVEGCV
jgi:hypothetical protein